MDKTDSLIPIERIASQIYLIRAQEVMLDQDLAALYGVETRALNQAVSRNRSRFPEDFMFRLSWEEYRILRSQNVILEGSGRGRHRKYTPRAFTQEGVAMLSGVLRSRANRSRFDGSLEPLPEGREAVEVVVAKNSEAAGIENVGHPIISLCLRGAAARARRCWLP